MVTKSTRMQSRRTSTAAKVFSAAELLEGELGLNLADRKLYSKTAGGAVFQIGGEPGRDVGDYVAYEDFIGSGFQGIGVKQDGRVWFKRDKDKKAEFATVWMTKNIDVDAPGTDAVGSVAVLRVDETINRGDLESFHFMATFNLNYEPLTGGGSGGGGQHVALYPRVDKRGSGHLWAICGEMRDFTSSPDKASVGQELTLAATGLDPNNNRIGLHLSLFSANNLDGTNVWSDGLVIGGPIAKVQAKRLIRLQGATTIGIDMTELETGYADVAVKLRDNHKIEWHPNFASTTPGGSIAWNASIATFQISGLIHRASATGGVSTALPANPVGYLELQINGDLRRIPYYGT